MAKKQFKTESKRILDLMINSIYTHKEIFLRELISNASDALDKLYYLSLTDNKGITRGDLAIDLKLDRENRRITISDNGIGMDKDGLENNLGVIAKSGTLAFKEENELKDKDDMDIIGQFGVGFYSAFMVASNIKVISKAFGSEQAYVWESSGEDGYTIKECEKASNGTDIIITVKESAEGEDYDAFLTEGKISSLVKKYSDYIRYPIRMDMQQTRLKEGSDKDYETVTENTVLNSMVPLWRRNKSELKDEDYNNFYKEKFFDFEDPLRVIHTKAEGAVSYTALLYIPARTPFDFYTKEYKKGLALYSNGVMIMDKCEDLLPDHFGFVRGLVDSSDLSLNISRELLQHDRQLKAIGANIRKKIKSELEKMLKNDREKYGEFFKTFGLSLKYGVYQGYGQNKDELQDLLLFYSLNEKKLITLDEYVTAMKNEQKEIYYACGPTVERIALLPQLEAVTAKGYDVLCLTDDVDEFAVKMIMNYKEKAFKSVAAGDLDVETDEEKAEAEKQAKESEDILKKLKDALGGKVADVKLSTRLKSHPVCLSSQGELSIEMEKVLNNMPMDNKVKADKVLEINGSHPVFAAVKAASDEDIKKYAALLYDQALLIEGLPIEDPVAFSNAICELMAK